MADKLTGSTLTGKTIGTAAQNLALFAAIGYKQVLERKLTGIRSMSRVRMQTTEVQGMPNLDRVIKEEDLRSSRSSAGMDLAPYMEILDRIAQEGGVGGEVSLSADESQRTEKRRLSVAAKQRGMKLTWRKSPQGRLRFVLASQGAPPPDGRRRRRSG